MLLLLLLLVQIHRIQFVAAIWPIRQHTTNQMRIKRNKKTCKIEMYQNEEEKRLCKRRKKTEAHRNEIVSTQAMHMLTVFGWIFILSHSLIYIRDFQSSQQSKWSEQFYGNKAIEIKAEKWENDSIFFFSSLFWLTLLTLCIYVCITAAHLPMFECMYVCTVQCIVSQNALSS